MASRNIRGSRWCPSIRWPAFSRRPCPMRRRSTWFGQAWPGFSTGSFCPKCNWKNNEKHAKLPTKVGIKPHMTGKYWKPQDQRWAGSAGDWVRLKKGPYGGDLAQVGGQHFRSNASIEMVRWMRSTMTCTC